MSAKAEARQVEGAPAAASLVPRCLADSVALVTGAGRGIGRAIGLGLAGEGAAVALAARSADQIKRVADDIEAAGGRAVAIACDLTENGAADALVDRVEAELGPLTSLVNAAGISTTYARAEDVEESHWDAIMSTNATAPFLLCQAAGRRMLARGDGAIVNIVSVGGVVALPRLAAYCASKGALIGLTRVLAVEWCERGVRVNAVAPAYVHTRMSADLIDHPRIGAQLLSNTPMQRFGEASEVAAAVAFLLSDDARYVTGQTLCVDGGWTAH